VKEVQPAYDFMTPPAAAQEDIGQPLGPLEEGDQALVDAVASFPEGSYEVPHKNGKTFMVKKGIPGQDVIAINKLNADGSTESTGALIEKRLSGHASAEVSGQPAHQIHGYASAQAFGNKAGTSVLNVVPDRQKAQEIKKVAAQEIETASEAIRQQA
jgi:hypothetical protein